MRVNFPFFIVAFFLLTKISFAQKFNAGLIAGISTTQVDGDNLSGFHKVGIKTGGFVSRKISEKFNLQFEIEFIQKGSRRPLTDDGIYYLMRLNYIEVPLMLNYFVGKKWNIEAGFSFATLVSSLEENEEGEFIDRPSFHRADYLANAGGNYFITDHLIFNARYSYSMVPIRPVNPNASYLYFNRGEYNAVLAFSLACQF